jgi:ribonucleoside-diphosphate reductase alpha chain
VLNELNLTEAVIRPNDMLADVERKVRIAAILGTLQSTLTDFRGLRKIWKDNCEEERLLGVSLTGIYDHPDLGDITYFDLPEHLEYLKRVAVDTNKEFAAILKIPQSAAITCVKPSGTVSQLVDAASGIHPRHAPYYIRRVRCDKKDPLSDFMIQHGVPYEEDCTNPSAWVFSFPMKSPDGVVTRDDVTAIDQLELWWAYAMHWCEHKPSVTITVREHEWADVAAWVWEHFDMMSGVSFLPHSDHVYRQAPYETITKEQYEALKEKAPKEGAIDWDALVEESDQTTSSKELACVGGACEIL